MGSLLAYMYSFLFLSHLVTPCITLITFMHAVLICCSSISVKVQHSLSSVDIILCSICINTAWLLAGELPRWSVTWWKTALCVCLFPYRLRASRRTVACGCTSRRVPLKPASQRHVNLSRNTTRPPSASSRSQTIRRRPNPAAVKRDSCITRRTTDGGFTSRRLAPRDQVVAHSVWRSRSPPRCSLAGDRWW